MHDLEVTWTNIKSKQGLANAKCQNIMKLQQYFVSAMSKLCVTTMHYGLVRRTSRLISHAGSSSSVSHHVSIRVLDHAGSSSPAHHIIIEVLLIDSAYLLLLLLLLPRLLFDRQESPMPFPEKQIGSESTARVEEAASGEESEVGGEAATGEESEIGVEASAASPGEPPLGIGGRLLEG